MKQIKKKKIAENTKNAKKNIVQMHVFLQNSSKSWKQKYRISEWAEFQVWKFLHLQKLAHCKELYVTRYWYVSWAMVVHIIILGL